MGISFELLLIVSSINERSRSLPLHFPLEITFVCCKGSSINDVTVLGGGGRGFCDNSTKALVIKPVTMGGGGGQKLFKIA